MDPTIQDGRLKERISDERQAFHLINQLRAVLNRRGMYEPEIFTQDATPSAIWNMSIRRTTSLWLEFSVVAYSDTVVSGMAFHKTALFAADVNGNAVFVGGNTVEPNVGAQPWIINITSAAEQVALVVTGAAATEIHWRAAITAIEAPLAKLGA